jgi:hypothetical protein
MKGFSLRNLKYMRRFAEVWAEEEFVQQVAAQLPWFHNCVLLDKVGDRDERIWYARAAIHHGWSRAVLVHQIESAGTRLAGAPAKVSARAGSRIRLEDEAYTRAAKTALRTLVYLLASLLPAKAESVPQVALETIRRRVESMVKGLVQDDWQEVALREVTTRTFVLI